MDNASMKERNYRIVNSLRQQNQREQRRLQDRLYSKQGLEASHTNQIKAVAKEQQRIKQELSTIRKSMTTTWGLLPPRGQSPNNTAKVGKAQQLQTNGLDSMLYGNGLLKNGKTKPQKQQRKEIEKPMVLQSEDNHSPTKDTANASDVQVVTNPIEDTGQTDEENTTEPPRTKNTASPIIEINIEEAKENAKKRLTTGQDAAQEAKARPKNDKQTRLAVKDPAPFLAPIEEQRTQESLLTKKETNGYAPSKNIRSSNATILESSNVTLKNAPVSESKSVSFTSKNVVMTERNPAPESTGKKPLKRRDSDIENAAIPERKPVQELTGKKPLKRRDSDNERKFDNTKFNPDGSLRTVHKMPDFNSRITEARKARYIRHKEKQPFEKELTVSDIFIAKGASQKSSSVRT